MGLAHLALLQANRLLFQVTAARKRFHKVQPPARQQACQNLVALRAPDRKAVVFIALFPQ
jgi:hypothetical protein